jgi:hypothetical protein
MSDPAFEGGLPRDWRPMCPGCFYDLSGIPDGRCPECARGFGHAELRAAADRPDISLLTDAQQAAVLRVTGWASVLCLPLFCVVHGMLITLRAGSELRRGCHWTDTNYDSFWTPITGQFPTAREALFAGLTWLGAGIVLCLLVTAAVRGLAWIFVRAAALPYTSESDRRAPEHPPR